MSDEQDFPERLWFTPLLNKIADIAGTKAAILIGHEKSGQLIYIPEKMSEDHWLALLIGFDNAAALSETFGSQKLDIPPAIGGEKRKRAALLADMIDKGYSINTITRLTGVSRSTVKEHLKRNRLPDPQGSLF